ncbi:MAG: DUF5519 family protein [Nocardioides sp.]|nr:DUF5519 family protein [Nocardioides sp.]
MTDSSLASTIHWRSSSSDDAPLFVLVHASGEGTLAARGLVERLPAGLEYAVLPAPGSVDELARWLDEAAPQGRPVFCAAHGHAAELFGALLVAEPARFVGAALLNGAFSADTELLPAALTGLPVFHAQGERDLEVAIPMQNRTWDYLVSESGAPVTAHLDSGGHDITSATSAELEKWLEHRLEHVASHGVAPVGPLDGGGQAQWPVIGELPTRRGGRPRVTWSIPQQQISDQSIIEFQDELFERVSGLEGVKVNGSAFSVPGTRGLALAGPAGRSGALLDEESGEFAHFHPWYDGSLHLALPPDLAADAIAKGWAQPHMWAGSRFADGFVLVYGPRDSAEVDLVAAIVEASHAYASGAESA